MEKEPSISIIIPVYNRVHLVAETLRSIKSQSFTNWECIIVDDGSSDGTQDLLKAIALKDKRFTILERPSHTIKGGNTCRNIGLEAAQGNYIQFFDSDDLMQPNMLEHKIQLLEQGDFDYVISKTANFEDPDSNKIIAHDSSYYQFVKYPLTHFNYVSQKINWLTPDFLGRRELIGELRFNPLLPSGQEYNFYCKVTARSVKAGVLDEFITLRRMHSASIRSQLNNNEKRLWKERIILRRETYNDLKNESSKEIVRFLFDNWLKATLEAHHSWSDFFKIAWILFWQGRWITMFWYKAFFFIKGLTGRGHFFRKKVLNCLE